MTKSDAPLTLKMEYIHKFVASFNTLSRARRELRSLDLPKRIIVEDTSDDQSPVSIDQEVARLTRSLAVNDPSTRQSIERMLDARDNYTPDASDQD